MGKMTASLSMSIGLALVLVAIIGFATYSRGFRRAVAIALVLIVGAVFFLLNNTSTQDYQDCVAMPS
jgi:hypothetical protein